MQVTTTSEGYEATETTRTRFAFPRDMNDLQEIVRRCGGHFFDESSMRYFGSKVDYTFEADPKRSVVYFVTSEKDRATSFGPGAWGGRRRYTVRVWSAYEPTNCGEPTGYEFGQFATLETARKHARSLAGKAERAA